MKSAVKLFAFSLALTLGLGLLYLVRNNYQFFSVQSGSMAPNIPVGALVITQKVQADSLRTGDIITYYERNNPQRTITHRIVTIDRAAAKSITTKGDVNTQADEPISPRQILGKTFLHIPLTGYVANFVRHPAGLALLIYLPSLYVIINETRLLIRKLIALEKSKAPLEPGGIYLRQLKVREHQLSPHIVLLGSITALRPFAKLQHKQNALTTLVVRQTLAAVATAIILPILCVSIITAPKTYAALTAQVTLEGTNITIQSPQPNASGILLRDIQFQCKSENTDLANRRPRIVIYNPTKNDVIATDWHLDDNSGRIVTLPPNTRLKAKKMYVLTPLLRDSGNYGLQYSGDFIALYDAENNLADGVSWGTDSSILNPPLPNTKEGTRLKRVPPKKDSNLASDWNSTTKKCSGAKDQLEASELDGTSSFTVTEIQPED